MTVKPVLCAVVMLAALFCGPGGGPAAWAAVGDDIAHCRASPDPFRRLTCYDKLADEMSGTTPDYGSGSYGSGASDNGADYGSDYGSDSTAAVPAKPRNPNAIAEFAGSGQFLTRVFYAPVPWEIRWRANGGNLQIFLSDNLGNFLEVVATQAGPGPGSKAMPEPGAFTLNINANGSWAVEVLPAGQ